MFDVDGYWQDIAAKDRERLRAWFAPSALIRWHCTNEQFTLEEFLLANCDYPGQWHGCVERAETLADHQILTVAHVWNQEKTIACHVVSFFTLQGGRILALDEYWGDDTSPPQWRQHLQLGRKITGQSRAGKP